MSDVLNIAKAQYSSKLAEELQFFEVPQWLDDEGKPVKIYFRTTMRLSQRSIMLKHYQNDRFDKALACRLIFQARDKDGKALFQLNQIDQIVDEFDPNVVQFICNKFEEAEPSQDEITKN
tara:strand:+ start:189 stop:548 length:360 start_codon:yes stop_codon:yes gene_type:complete